MGRDIPLKTMRFITQPVQMLIIQSRCSNGSSKGLKQRGRHSFVLSENFLKDSSFPLEQHSNKAAVMLRSGSFKRWSNKIRHLLRNLRESRHEWNPNYEWLALETAQIPGQKLGKLAAEMQSSSRQMTKNTVSRHLWSTM